jgi:ArsR family transcriptional regulator, arsenate/arsenite/antimonite-responsive transcriptional repressor / arsenate reductase (thioredoxin)
MLCVMRGNTDAGSVSPPRFLRLAGHPVRWRLLSELALSDRRVRELMHLTGRPQSLVSYHLAKLRRSGIVTASPSAADRRDSYYHLELARCGKLVSATGRALHPALDLNPASPPLRRLRSRQRVLFLCTGNSARSQIAEALIERMTGGTVEARSAGSHPKPLHPFAVDVMRTRGIDISRCRSKKLDEFLTEQFHFVVSLCDKVREICPDFPNHPKLTHWSIPDPARIGESDEETYAAFEDTLVELEARVTFLLHRLASDPGGR